MTMTPKSPGPKSGAAAQAVVEQLNQAGSGLELFAPGVGKLNLRQYVYEVCWAALRKEITVTKLPTAIRAADSSDAACEETLGNVLWFLWLEVSGAEASLRTRLIRCVEEVLAAGLVSRESLLEAQEVELLEEAGLVESRAAWEAKEAALADALLHSGAGACLFSEEVEGYSKLLTVLGESQLRRPPEPAELLADTERLIGAFQLAPDRVLACVLDALEAGPAGGGGGLRHLLPHFDQHRLVQVLGFRLQSAGGGRASGGQPLYRLTVDMIQAGLVPLDGVYAHLSPSNDEFAAAYAAAWAAADSVANGIGVINLADVSKAGGPKPVISMGAASLDLDARSMEASFVSALSESNQKVALLAAMAEAGQWETFDEVMKLLKPLQLQLGAFPQLCTALCGALNTIVAPLHARAFCLKRNGSAAPEAATPEDLPSTLFAALSRLGMWIYRDLRLLVKVVRVLKWALASQPQLQPQVVTALHQSIAPAASLFPANPALSSELWTLLSALPYASRFLVYANLSTASGHNPFLKAVAKKATVEVKRILRRLHVPQDRAERKKKLKPFGRTMGKIGHAAPLAVMEAIVQQTESFGSAGIGEPLLEALRYLTPMGYDVMTFVILDRISMSRGKKLKEDGINLADWLVHLASFAGQVCKRFTDIEVTALCQYVTNQLKQQESYDMLVLKEIITQVTGIITVDDLNEGQVEALAGGDSLRHETITLTSTVRNRKALQRGTRRLLEALQKGEQDDRLLLPLAILMAQQRNLIITQTSFIPLKGIGELYDRCQQTFCQYVEFLQTAVPDVQQYMQLMPSMETLHQEYRLDAEVIFALWRPVLQALPRASAAATAAADGEDEEMEEGEAPVAGGAVDGGGSAAPLSLSWTEVSAAVRCMLPATAWNGISPELYVTFWTYNLYDIYVPTERYKSEIERLKGLIRQKEVQLAGRGREMAGGGRSQREGSPSDEVTVLKKERGRLQETVDRLAAEMAGQERRVAAVHASLRAEKDGWLQKSADAKDENGAVMMFIQHCVVPRVMFSPTDALYCCKFAKLLIEMGTPSFSCLIFFDKVLKLLVNRVICITDREASNLAIFLKDILSTTETWRSTAEAYRAVAELPGFCIKLADPTSRRATFEEFRKLTSRWQAQLTKTFVTALDSREYTQLRATLLVLVTLVKIPFPAKKTLGHRLQAAVKEVIERETREDLKMFANMYSSQLTQQMNTAMVDEEEYGGVVPKKPPPAVKKQQSAAPAQPPPPAAAAPQNEAHKEDSRGGEKAKAVSAPAVEEVKGKVESRASGKPKAPAPTTAKEGTKETAKGKEEGAKVTEKTKAAVAPKGVEEEARAAEKAKAVSAPAAEEVKGKEEGRAAEKAKAPTASVAEEEKAKEKAKAKAEEGPKVAEKTKASAAAEGRGQSAVKEVAAANEAPSEKRAKESEGGRPSKAEGEAAKRGGESGRASRGEKERVGQSSKDGGAAVAAPVAAAAAAATATAAAAADKGRSERKRGREEAAEVRPSLEFIIVYKNP